MSIERIAAAASVLVIIGSICLTFGIQMERLAGVKGDVEGLRGDIQELRSEMKESRQRTDAIMQGIGEMENRRWRETHP